MDMVSDDLTNDSPMITDEIGVFEKEMEWIKGLSANPFQVGTEQEMEFLRNNTDMLDKEYQGTIEKFKLLSLHAHDMKMFACERKIMVGQQMAANPWNNPNHLSVLKNRPLDPSLSKQTKGINLRYATIDLQLEKVLEKQHMTWMEHLNLPKSVQKCVVPVASIQESQLKKPVTCLVDKQGVSSKVLKEESSDEELKKLLEFPNNVSDGKCGAAVCEVSALSSRDDKPEQFLVDDSIHNFVDIWSSKDFKTKQDVAAVCSNSPSIVTGKKVSILKKYKDAYENLMSTLSSFELVEEFRKLLDGMVQECIGSLKEELRKAFNLNQTKNSQGTNVDEYMKMITRKLETFEQYIASVKLQLIAMYNFPASSVVSKCNDLFVQTETECMLLHSLSPFYAFKKDLISLMEQNQVIVIVADALYLVNFMAPIFHKAYSEHGMVAVCEPNAVMAAATFQSHVTFNKNAVVCSGLNQMKVGVTDIVVTTVQDLFKFSLSDSDLNDFVCVVVVVSLKRSEETDFLLRVLKKCAQQRSAFKLILNLMPNDDVKKFEQYFSTDCSTDILTVPSLLFPVQTIWKKTHPSEDYIQDVVHTALSVHTLNKPGDVLVFVPSVRVGEEVSGKLSLELQKFHYLDAECICSHADDADQQFHFDNKKRKFIIADGYAETLLFPTVNYVIDSGLSVVSVYDEEKGSEVKRLSFISRSRAKLRKNCAGRYRPGFCYRIYSKGNYFRDMKDYEQSDVRQRDPFNIVLKMFRYFSSNFPVMDMVEPLPIESANKAISMLEDANALRNGQLSTLGELIVKLPFLPKYSKLIILGIQWGFPFETVLLVAFCLIQRSVFLSENNKQDPIILDVKKKEFLFNDSETLTYLNVYRLWMENGYQKEWCKSNCLNATILGKVKKKVTQIISIINTTLEENVSTELQACEDQDWIAIQEIMLECFKGNLSIYSGHNRSGYRLHSSQSIAFLHPSSPVLQKRDLPKFLVFNSLHAGTRDTMHLVTAFSEQFILLAVSKGTLPESVMDLFHSRLDRFVIEPVSLSVIKSLVREEKGCGLFRFEEKIKDELKSNQVILEPSEEKGSITLYALPENIKTAEIVVSSMLQDKLDNLLIEEEERYVELKRGINSIVIDVTWTKGGQTINAVHNTQQSSSLSREKNCESFEPSSVKKKIVVTWPRRLCKGYALVSFHGDGFSLARRFAMKSFDYNGKSVDIQIQDPLQELILINGLPPESNSGDLECALKNFLPEDVNINEVSIAHDKPFETSDEVIKRCRGELEQLCDSCCSCNFEINIDKPDVNSITLSATIHLHDYDEIDTLLEKLNSSCRFKGFQAKTEVIYSSEIYTSMQIFNAIQDKLPEDFKLLEESLLASGNLTSSRALDVDICASNSSTVIFLLMTKNSKVMNSLLEVLHRVLNGLVMSCECIEGLHKLFTHGGHMWLRATEKKENVYIIDNYNSRTLHIYGSVEACMRTARRISEFLENLKDEVVSVISLSGEETDHRLLKAVIQNYGFNLESLVEDCHLIFAQINVRTSEITLQGSAEAVENAQLAIRKTTKKYVQADPESSLDKEICPVCQIPAVTLSIRLERCNHLYCFECLTGLILNTDFPIQCCAMDCDKRLLLEDIRRGLDYNEDLIVDLICRSLDDYIVRSDKLVHCPAPDCRMFYEKREIWPFSFSANSTLLNCRLCRNDICRKCNVLFHHGYTCDVYQGSKLDSNYGYKVWVKEKQANSQLCPTCQTGIEKNGGCNHMQCNSCKTHFCWSCRATFAQGSEAQQHVPYCQGL